MRSRPTSRLRPLATTAAALIALSAAAPAYAVELPPQDRGDLFLTVSGAENTWIRGVLLTCEPEPSGRHPHAAKACAAIERAGGDLDALPAESGICTKQYAPVTVSASGTYRGRPVGWHKTYDNACTMTYSTGDVFRF
ncbi:subtilase-type protease inhibitor [Streptomyces sp. NBC_01381]|uniref:SSI family serine proteinase inhibitor n=1 Tax=Streptomyces sp. NBC_01381 TaxID=2903845 RepID=UPI0022566AA9|nr:SSI family serine proteinase inhibitor [Streptomyces sp. NBC_01381]MCX4672820.1 subtilase-type protease inhibitor [Streptomyces sp. NBC_01381]